MADPKIEITIDLETLLVEEVKVKDYEKKDGTQEDRVMIENEKAFQGHSTVLDQIPVVKPDDPPLSLREKHMTILHANPTYIVIGGRIYCWH